jgi:hypothetical protein
MIHPKSKTNQNQEPVKDGQRGSGWQRVGESRRELPIVDNFAGQGRRQISRFSVSESIGKDGGSVGHSNRKSQGAVV